MFGEVVGGMEHQIRQDDSVWPNTVLWAGSANDFIENPPRLPARKFACLLITDGSLNQLDVISEQLIKEGCRYFVCWGKNCSALDDVIDHTAVVMKIDGDLNEQDLVMTTWHETETLSEVVWYSKECALPSEEVQSSTLVVIVLDCPEILTELRVLLEAHE